MFLSWRPNGSLFQQKNFVLTTLLVHLRKVVFFSKKINLSICCKIYNQFLLIVLLSTDYPYDFYIYFSVYLGHIIFMIILFFILFNKINPVMCSWNLFACSQDFLKIRFNEQFKKIFKQL